MEAIRSSETSVNTSTRCHIPEDCFLHFNIVHPPTPWSSQWSLSFWLSHQYPIRIPRQKKPTNIKNIQRERHNTFHV
jgi:hypothetical protein